MDIGANMMLQMYPVVGEGRREVGQLIAFTKNMCLSALRAVPSYATSFYLLELKTPHLLFLSCVPVVSMVLCINVKFEVGIQVSKMCIISVRLESFVLNYIPNWHPVICPVFCNVCAYCLCPPLPPALASNQPCWALSPARCVATCCFSTSADSC